ncbi:hypothetical protein FA15DRAFT_707451 [Coprinopsis marcescibilis]|uniref:Uncharacterized protein n=1 Tax=Coprinopsis marcescibilis TaxID=230819 RepID=A0A5C3KMB5_COPMA|nr:hypothetical protein FA15DRAFT_707451 [Coprinopsis marcescibilis]
MSLSTNKLVENGVYAVLCDGDSKDPSKYNWMLHVATTETGGWKFHIMPGAGKGYTFSQELWKPLEGEKMLLFSKIGEIAEEIDVECVAIYLADIEMRCPHNQTLRENGRFSSRIWAKEAVRKLSVDAGMYVRCDDVAVLEQELWRDANAAKKAGVCIFKDAKSAGPWEDDL